MTSKASSIRKELFRMSPLYLLAGLLGMALPLFLYRHSSFFGWGRPKGGEAATLILLAVALFIIYFLAGRKLARLLVPVSMTLGLIVGLLGPWSQSDPFWAKSALVTPPEQIWEVKRVAHAGGAISGKIYTNSIEALNKNSDDFDYFELDFVATSDGHLVCLHGWGEGIHEKIFGEVLEAPVSLEEFNKLNREGPFTACNMDSLRKWLQENPEAYVVTDVKEPDLNVTYLKRLKESWPGHVERLIPQAYSFGEIRELKGLGFEKIILTTYRFGGIDPETFLRNVEKSSPFAVTMSQSQAGSLSSELNANGIPVYVFTVNNHQWFAELRKLGVSNIYTDTLNDTDEGY